MIIETLFSILGFFLSILICYILIPFIIKSAKSAGMITKDAHKLDKPDITEPGGLAPLLAFTGSFSAIILIIAAINQILSANITIAFGDFDLKIILDDLLKNFSLNFETIELATLLGALLSVVIAGFIGFLDDIFGINMKWKHKILFGFFPAFPLMILKVGTPDVDVPFIGIVQFGIFFALIIVPLATNFGFNSVNMLAGYNGLETGLGLVSFGTIFIASFLKGRADIMIFTACMLGALLVLYLFNKYPAKTLIGDTGTLMMGTGLVVAIILGNMERLSIGIFLLYIINFILFFFYVKKGFTQKLADIEQVGNKVILRPPCPYTVYWFFPYYFNLTEKQNVFILIGIQFIICFVTLFWFLVSTS